MVEPERQGYVKVSITINLIPHPIDQNSPLPNYNWSLQFMGALIRAGTSIVSH